MILNELDKLHILVPKPMAHLYTSRNNFNGLDIHILKIYKAESYLQNGQTDESTLARQPINTKGLGQDANVTVHGITINPY